MVYACKGNKLFISLVRYAVRSGKYSLTKVAILICLWSVQKFLIAVTYQSKLVTISARIAIYKVLGK